MISPNIFAKKQQKNADDRNNRLHLIYITPPSCGHLPFAWGGVIKVLLLCLLCCSLEGLPLRPADTSPLHGEEL